MFDIIELNETEQELQPTKTIPQQTTITTKLSLPTKKTIYTKKPIQPTKKVSLNKKEAPVKHLPSTTTARIQSVDEIDEKLTKEFEMMPDIKDTSVKLNRTFRKELPPITNDGHTSLESGSQFGVPRIINFTITNALESDDSEELQQDQPQPQENITEVASTVVKKNQPKLEEDDENIGKSKKPEVTEKVPQENIDEVVKTTSSPPIQNPIDPRLFVLNNHPHLPKNNHSEPIPHKHPETFTEKSRVSKQDFLPKSLLGESSEPTTPHSGSSDGYSEHPFPSDEPKKVNRHRSLHTNKGRKFYPYFFSRMLG